MRRKIILTFTFDGRFVAAALNKIKILYRKIIKEIVRMYVEHMQFEIYLR